MIFAETLPDFPTNITALGLLGFALWWLFRRMDRADSAREQELRDTEAQRVTLQVKYDALTLDNADQHRDKHKALNRIAFLEGRAQLVRDAANRCHCGAMAPLLVLINEDFKHQE